MAANRPTESVRRAPARAWASALLVSTVGIVGVVYDSWPKSFRVQWLNLHVIFGLLLWIMVVAKFQQARSGSRGDGADLHSICRQLSRAVYFLLYVVFGANQIVRCAVFLWNRATIGATHPAIVQPPENLRDYLVYGIFALVTIRALSALHRHTLKRAGLPQRFPTTNTTNDSAISAGRG